MPKLTKDQIEATLDAKAQGWANGIADAALKSLSGVPGFGGALAAGLDAALDHVGKEAAVSWLVRQARYLLEDALKAVTGDDYGVAIEAEAVEWHDNRSK